MTTWSPDQSLPGFQAATLDFPDDYEGRVVATLVKKAAPQATSKAVLYVHGFIDYFFQAHLAEAYAAHGFDFYALDLRKYGRSLLPHQRPNFCRDVHEYFADITAALDIIAAEGHTFIAANGHSTGGLTLALYADHGPRRDRIKALFLNSPFLDINETAVKKLAVGVAGAIGKVQPYLMVKNAVSALYPMSLHRDHHGEWDFDTRWKPIDGFPAYYGWLGAIRAGHKQVQAGLNIQCPVLLMHSDKSVYGQTWREDFKTGDAVLNVEHMKAFGPGLGRTVKLVEITDGLHDLVLSGPAVRAQVLDELFRWLDPLAASAASSGGH